MRSGVDVDGQRSGAAVRGRRELVIGVRLVIAALSQVGDEPFERAIDIGLPVLVALRQADARTAAFGSGSGELPVTSIVLDAEPHAGIHVDHERVAILALRARAVGVSVGFR